MLDHSVLSRLCTARDRLRQAAVPSAERVALDAGFSVYHFTRLFKAVFGLTPYQCLLQAKLERAAFLLATTGRQVRAISLELGFASLGSFSSLFSKHEGLSPIAYRKRFRPMIRVPGRLPPELQPGCMTLMTLALSSLTARHAASPAPRLAGSSATL